MPNLIDFHRSTAAELMALTNRVRNLVKHWGEDGRYKEAVLRNVIQRFLPQRFLIGSGFVVRGVGYEQDHQVSKQLDLIIYDSAYPVLFKEADFVILTADAVRGIIEVKANLENQNIADVFTKANEAGLFIGAGKQKHNQPFFNGIFSYEVRANFRDRAEGMTTKLVNDIAKFMDRPNATQYVVNHVAFDSDHFVKAWYDQDIVSLYDIQELAFAYFISNLLMMLTDDEVEHERLVWFPRNKELDNRRDFPIR